jgi:hypothetical protein
MRARAGTVIVEAAKSPRSFGAPSSRFIQHQGGPSPLAGKFNARALHQQSAAVPPSLQAGSCEGPLFESTRTSLGGPVDSLGEGIVLTPTSARV